MQEALSSLLVAAALLATFGAAGLIAWELAEWLASWRR